MEENSHGREVPEYVAPEARAKTKRRHGTFWWLFNMYPFVFFDFCLVYFWDFIWFYVVFLYPWHKEDLDGICCYRGESKDAVFGVSYKAGQVILGLHIVGPNQQEFLVAVVDLWNLGDSLSAIAIGLYWYELEVEQKFFEFL